MFKVTIEFEFCYGHRLQRYEGKCHHLHGHNARVQVTVESDRLDGQGFVADFTTLKHAIKKWVDDEFDHKMILQRGDPYVKWLDDMDEPINVISNPPTAENLALLILDMATTLDKRTTSVKFWETSTSFAEVTNGGN